MRTRASLPPSSHPQFADGTSAHISDVMSQLILACVYKALGEELIGGWCKVFRERKAGQIDEYFVEVSLEEYSSGQSNWRSKPATMIQKVAKSQAFRAAFPNEYEGIYTVDEMQASGAIPADYVVIEETGEVVAAKQTPAVTNAQRQELFRAAKQYFGDDANSVIKDLLSQEGLSSTEGMLVTVYETIMERMKKMAEEKEQSLSGEGYDETAE